MLVYAILSDSARLCAAWVEFAFRTLRRPAQPNLRCAYEAQRSTTKSDAHKTHKVGVLNKVGRKRCPRKDDAFPVAGPYFGASTPVRRNGTGPSRGKARGGYTSPIPAEIAWMRWVYLGRGPLVRPHRRKRFHRHQSFFERFECPGGGSYRLERFRFPPKIPGTRVPKFGAAPWFSHEAAVSAVHRGDGGALAESTPNCGLPTSLNRLRGLSPRFINTSEVRVEVPSTDPPARAGFCVP
jgi:hypothetical protein